MFISLNKKFFYMISTFVILIFIIFLISFYNVYGRKFIEEQNTSSSNNIKISSLLTQNNLFIQEIKKLKKENPKLIISPKIERIIEEKNKNTLPIIAQRFKTLQNFKQNYDHRYRSNKLSIGMITLSIIVTLLLTLLVASLIRRWLLTPINMMTIISDKVSLGDLTSQVPEKDNIFFQDEWSKLIKTFNQMLKNLNKSFDEIKQKEHFLQSLIDSIPDGIRVIDKDYNIVIANKAYYEQTGAQAPRLPLKCYQSSQHLKTPCQNHDHICPLKEIFNNNLTKFNTIQQFSNSQKQHYAISAAPMILNIPNTSPQEYIVEAIRDLNEQIEFSHQQKLSSIEFLGTSIAHEIKNSLGAIRIIVNSLLAAPFDKRDAKENEFLQLISNQLENCIKIPEQLLALGRNIAAEDTSFDSLKSLKETISLLDYEAKRHGIIINLNNNVENTTLYGNSGNFEMALINLIQNAINAIDNSGNITININQKKKTELIFEIIDNGKGIPARNLKRIFEPFYSTNKNYPQHGTGLGLPITKSIVEKMSGTLSIKSSLNQGTCITLKFPQTTINKKKAPKQQK